MLFKKTPNKAKKFKKSQNNRYPTEKNPHPAEYHTSTAHAGRAQGLPDNDLRRNFYGYHNVNHWDVEYYEPYSRKISKATKAKSVLADIFSSFFTFVIIVTAGFVVGYFLSSYEQEGTFGKATKLNLAETPLTPDAEKYSGDYYVLSVGTNKMLPDVLLDKGLLPNFLFMAPPAQPESTMLSRDDEGELYGEMSDQWLSTGLGYVMAKNLIEKSTTLSISDYYDNDEPNQRGTQTGNTTTSPSTSAQSSNNEGDLFSVDTIADEVEEVKRKILDEVNNAPKVQVYEENKSWMANRENGRGYSSKISLQAYEFITEHNDNIPRPQVQKGLRGRSSDLVYFLLYLEAQQPGSLSNGRQIAATGIVSEWGSVVDVGGLGEKIDAFVETSSKGENPKINESGEELKPVMFYPAYQKEIVDTHIASQSTQLDYSTVTFVPVFKAKEAVAWLCSHRIPNLTDAGAEPPICSAPAIDNMDRTP